MSLCLNQIVCCYLVTLSSPNGLSARKAGYPMYFSNPRTHTFTRKRATPGNPIPPFFFRLRDVRESYCCVMTSLIQRRTHYYLWASSAIATTTCRYPMQLCCAVFYQFLFFLSRVNLSPPYFSVHTKRSHRDQRTHPNPTPYPPRKSSVSPTITRFFRRILEVSCRKSCVRYSGLNALSLPLCGAG